MGTKALSKHDKLLRELARAPANKKCAICTCMGTQYTCQPPGIFVCETCAGVIRSFPGFRVKSRTMATYTAEDVNTLKDEGNERFIQTYLGKWNAAAFPAPTDRGTKSIETFVRQVLVEKLFYQGQQSEPQSSQPPKIQAVETNARIRASGLQSKSISEPGWRAFEGKVAHAPSSSFDQSRQNQNSDSWADFSSAPALSTSSQQMAQPTYDFDQTRPQIPRPPNAPPPQGWNAFDDATPHTAPSNPAPHTGGSMNTPVNASTAEQTIGATKAPIMKELPQDLFGPPQEHTPVNPSSGANPFGHQPFSPQANTFVQQSPAPSSQYALQGQHYMAQGMGPQGFSPRQPINPGRHQQLYHQSSFGPAMTKADAPFQGQSIAGNSFSPNMDTPSRVLSGTFLDGDESDHNLFGNLVGDLRSSMPMPRGPPGLMGSAGFQGGHSNYGDYTTDSQVGSFPRLQESAFSLSPQQQMSFDGEKAHPVGYRMPQYNKTMGSVHPQQNAFMNGQVPAQNASFQSFPQHAYPRMPPAGPVLNNGFAGQQDASQFTVPSGLTRQEQQGFQGSIQSSGNPFA